MAHFHYLDNQLTAEAVPLTRIAEQFGTPCFVYSRAALEQHFRAYEQALAGCDHLVCYAVKANSNLAVLSVLAKLGSGSTLCPAVNSPACRLPAVIPAR